MKAKFLWKGFTPINIMIYLIIFQICFILKKIDSDKIFKNIIARVSLA